MRPLSLALAAGALVLSCAANDEGTVRAALTTSSIRMDPAEVRSGPVLIRIENMSAIPHSIVLLRTDLPYDEIAIDQSDPTNVVRTGLLARIELPAKANAEVKLDLPKASYVLMCAQPSHYEYGMRAALALR